MLTMLTRDPDRPVLTLVKGMAIHRDPDV
jgi:hypothetical protein